MSTKIINTLVLHTGQENLLNRESGVPTSGMEHNHA
jgi:hypothetical protein